MIRMLSLEIRGRPSLYQVSVGGGTALGSQYREIGLLSITSRASTPKFDGDAVSPVPAGLLKLGGTEDKGERARNNVLNILSFKYFIHGIFAGLMGITGISFDEIECLIQRHTDDY